MTRDHVAEMNAAIAAAMAEGAIVASVTAEKLHARLLETDPDLLDGWLRASSVHFLAAAIGDRDRHRRALARSRGQARRFHAAAGDADPEAMSIFTTVRYVVDADETRRPLGEMTGADHEFVAVGYGRTATRAQMLAAFHRAVAKTVGRRRTAEVFTEEKYQELYRSIAGQAETS